MERLAQSPARPRRPGCGRASAVWIPEIEPAAADRDDRPRRRRARPPRSRGRRCRRRRSRPGRRTDGRACGRSPRCSVSRRSNASAGSRRLEVDASRRSRASRRSSARTRPATSRRARRRPLRAAANATACAWLPALIAITPLRFSSLRRGCDILFSAPRDLNEPVRWKSSHLSRALQRAAREERRAAAGDRRSSRVRVRRRRGSGGRVSHVGAASRRAGWRRRSTRSGCRRCARASGSRPARSATSRQRCVEAVVLGADEQRGRRRQVRVGVARSARRRPRRPSAAASARTSSSVVSTIGSVKTAPVDARIAFGFHGSVARVGDEQRVGAGRVRRARHRAEVARLLDPDRDEHERRVRGGSSRSRHFDDRRARPPARRGSSSSRARARSPPSPPCGQSGSSSGATYDRA